MSPQKDKKTRPFQSGKAQYAAPFGGSNMHLKSVNESDGASPDVMTDELFSVKKEHSIAAEIPSAFGTAPDAFYVDVETP